MARAIEYGCGADGERAAGSDAVGAGVGGAPSAGTASHGQKCHLYASLYVSLVIIHTKREA